MGRYAPCTLPSNALLFVCTAMSVNRFYLAQGKGQKTLEAILIGFNFWEQKSNEMVS